MPADKKTSNNVVYLNTYLKFIFLPCRTIKYPMSIASAAPVINPIYEKDPVIEKLEIKNTAVSKPSLKIAKKTTKNTPQEDSSIAFKVFPSSSFLSLTCF